MQDKNRENYLGHGDWRLPSAKELQSIVDYRRSPDTTRSAAIDPLFTCTQITNEAGQADYPFYWTATTHGTAIGRAAVYVSFGRALGYMGQEWQDVHGAGAQRSDPKAGDAAAFPLRPRSAGRCDSHSQLRPSRCETSIPSPCGWLRPT